MCHDLPASPRCCDSSKPGNNLMTRILLLSLCVLVFGPPAAGKFGTVAGTGQKGDAEAGNHCIRRLDLNNGTLTTVAGTGKPGYTGHGGPATRATLNEPYAVAAD